MNKEIESAKFFENSVCPKTAIEADVERVLAEIRALFGNKNEQYRTCYDDLANFTKGALMLGYEADEIGRFEALKGYVLKHISKVYNGKLNDDKMDESVMDIAVYFILATVMHKRMTIHKRMMREQRDATGSD